MSLVLFVYFVFSIVIPAEFMHLFTLTFFVFFSFISRAQRILPQAWFDQNNIKGGLVSIGDQSVLFGLSPFAKESLEEYYWQNDFQMATVYFYPQQIKSSNGSLLSLDSLLGVPLRFDLLNNLVEFQSDLGVKVISIKKVSHIIWMTEGGAYKQFINPKEFNVFEQSGLFELIKSKNKAAFLHSKEVLLQPANYNPALDTGNKEATYIIKDHFSFWNGEELRNIDQKKAVIGLLNDLGLNAKLYLKDSKNKLKSSADYKALAHFTLESMP